MRKRKALFNRRMIAGKNSFLVSVPCEKGRDCVDGLSMDSIRDIAKKIEKLSDGIRMAQFKGCGLTDCSFEVITTKPFTAEEVSYVREKAHELTLKSTKDLSPRFMSARKRALRRRAGTDDYEIDDGDVFEFLYRQMPVDYQEYCSDVNVQMSDYINDNYDIYGEVEVMNEEEDSWDFERVPLKAKTSLHREKIFLTETGLYGDTFCGDTYVMKCLEVIDDYYREFLNEVVRELRRDKNKWAEVVRIVGEFYEDDKDLDEIEGAEELLSRIVREWDIYFYKGIISNFAEDYLNKCESSGIEILGK